jgi:uncharacterized protein
MKMSFAFFIVLCAACFGMSAAFAQTALESFNKAVETDDARELKKWVAKGVDPNSQDARGDHALVVAARAGALSTVRALVEAKAKVNLRTRVGDTALMVAALGGQLPVVKFLRESGGDVNNSGWTALIYAASNGHTDIVKYLLDQGADPTAKAPNGVTALMMAARAGSDVSVNVLLEYGADVKHKADTGEDAIKWAEKWEHKTIEATLRKALAASK